MKSRTRVFNAVRTDDVVQFKAVNTPDFYLFDGGVRFNREGILALIKEQQEVGRRHEWNVTELDVHIIGDTLRQPRKHRRLIRDSDQQWLESAFLQKQEGTWKIVFLHSTASLSQLNRNQPK